MQEFLSTSVGSLMQFLADNLVIYLKVSGFKLYGLQWRRKHRITGTLNRISD